MTTRNKRNSLSSPPDIPMKKSDDGSSQEEDMSDSKWAHHSGGAAALRFSARVVEKQEKLLQKQFPAHVSHETQIMESEQSVSDVSLRNSKKKRNWTLWSSDDKQYFFDGLNEYGKDFDAIQNHISLKLKSKRSPTTTKNKDQVRHFYYRTWNKISKFLTFPEMKKAHQELYGLINYGELRKKQRVLNLKTAVKLSELVQKGSTTIKVRGKTFRIKTPVCRALKKLNRLEEPESKLPHKIALELLPQNGQAWVYVQNLSYNPRVRVHLSLQRSLASVIKFFEDRWKATDVKMKEQLLQTFGKPIPRLRFIPQGINHHLPHFKVLEATSASKISLRNYADCMLRSSNKTEFTGGGDDHDPENDNDTEDERMGVPESRHQNSSTSDIHHSNNLPSRHEEEDFLEKCNLTSAADCSKGWTSEEAGMITLGEVYLMLGSCATLHFEYKWDSYERSLSQSLISKVITVSNLLKKKKSYKTKLGSAQCPNCGYSPSCPTTSLSSKCSERVETGNARHPVSFNLEPGKAPSPVIQVPLQFFPTLNSPSAASQPQPSTSTENQNKSIILLPKGNRRAGRPANRKVIVPRVLPLLPKIDPCATPIFTVTATQNVLNTVHQQGHVLNLGPSGIQKQLNTTISVKPQESSTPPVLLLAAAESANSLTPSEFNDLIQLKSSASISENSSFSLSSFLDMTLPSPEPVTLARSGSSGSCLTSDKFLSCDDNSLLNLLECKQNSELEKKTEENLLSNGPWLTSESNDLSLSSLLGNLEGNSVDATQRSTDENPNPDETTSSFLNKD